MDLFTMLHPHTLYTPTAPGARKTWLLALVPLMLVFLTISHVALLLFARAPGIREALPENSWQHTASALLIGFGGAALCCMARVRMFERQSLASMGLQGNGCAAYGRGPVLGLALVFRRKAVPKKC